jgi:DNA-directed RNA polymerase
LYNLADAQVAIENEMLDEAKARQTRDLAKATARGAWAETKVAAPYVKKGTQSFVDTVRDFMNQDKTKGRRLNRAAELLSKTGLDAETVTFLFIKSLFNNLPKMKGKPMKRVTLSIRMADLIHDEWRIRHFGNQENRRNLLRKLFKDFDKRTYPRHWRLRTIKNYFYAEMMEWTGWTQKEKLHVGYALLVMFRDTTGMVNMTTSGLVEPSPELLEHLEASLAERVMDYMIYLPMVVPPLPWTEDHLFRGGYLSSQRVRPYAIIKGARRRDIKRMTDMDWSQVLPAVNALQETPWRLNGYMVDLLQWAMLERQGGFAGLPHASPQPLPPEPPEYRTNDDVKRRHNHTCFLIYDANRREVSKRLAVLFTLNIAQRFRTYEVIYFPHNLDTRGRAYPLPAFLNPQGGDYCKALLEFSEGEPIENEEQAGWLAIAGANAYGNDKVSLQERIKWVRDNEDLILSIAEDPMSDLRWADASEPFQFVRFCREWKQFKEVGYGYTSHMVVPVDATCSGLQHYSAMLRDEVGGKSVNLVPGLPRQDIYQDVADKVVEKLFRDSAAEPVMAKDWIKFGINRKITKRQVMVVPYAGTFSSCMEYTREAVSDRIKEGYECPWDTTKNEDHSARIVFLSRLIWEAIEEVVVKGKEAMRWLSVTARAYTKHINPTEGSAHDKRMVWTTPDGFEVIHFRPSMTKTRVETALDGRLMMTMYNETELLDSKDMALAVAPNFVHSLDACHLRMSVVRGLDNGVKSFGMVHDSFGVHASKMPNFLSQCVKPSFIAMYQHDVLEQLHQSMCHAGVMVEPPPSKGSLDLDRVSESEFFFS